MPTKLMDFDKGRSPQDQNKNDVVPKPKQSNTKTNATTRVTICDFTTIPTRVIAEATGGHSWKCAYNFLQ